MGFCWQRFDSIWHLPKKKGLQENLQTLETGVADGARTHDNRNHNPGLYQLSYSHRRSGIIAQRISNSGALAF
jgi:hypothetical protein